MPELLVALIVIALVSTIWLNLQALPKSSRERDTGLCLSNLKQIALAARMYAHDYNEVLPACVASDTQGTAHAVGGVFANRNWKEFNQRVTAKYGKRYLDGRWMWQLADLLRPYLKSEKTFNCLTLVRRDTHCAIRSYIVGTDARGRRDPSDPLRALVPGKDRRKVVQSGSYAYMCAHHPSDGTALFESDYGADAGVPIFGLWMTAVALGQADGPEPGSNPQDYLACANALRSFSHPDAKPLVMCNSLGVHEGYSPEYVNDHLLPLELGGLPPPITPAAPVAFVDGHAKYMRMTFYEVVGMLFARNR